MSVVPDCHSPYLSSRRRPYDFEERNPPMPSPNDKQLTLAYAAGASLAAVTLVYVFGPTWFIDSSNGSSRQRKTGVVGLVNTANDCFVCYTPFPRVRRRGVGY